MSRNQGAADISKKFDSVLHLRQEIDSVLEVLDNRLGVLRSMYKTMVKKFGSNEVYTLGMDSFHFQSSLIEADCAHLKKVYRDIDNRVYGEYYKLYGMILSYIGKDLKNQRLLTKLSKDFPAYKTLAAGTTYDISVTTEIHSLIAESILELEALIVTKETELDNDRKQNQLGINIDSLVHMHSFANMLVKARTNMFREHLEAFFAHHTRYYNRLLTRAKLHMGIVTEDISVRQFKESGSTDLVQLKADMSSSSPSNVPATFEQADGRNTVHAVESVSPAPDLSASTPIEVISASSEGKNVVLEDVDSTSDDLSVQSEVSVCQLHYEEPVPTADVSVPLNTEVKHLAEESEIAAGDVASDPRFSTDRLGARVGVLGYESLGTLRFYGDRIGGGGLRCGVELDDPVGRNNGSIGGVQYFACADKHGVLVVPNKVTFIDDAISEASDESEGKSQSTSL